jgi:hypothetical protein
MSNFSKPTIELVDPAPTPEKRADLFNLVRRDQQ